MSNYVVQSLRNLGRHKHYSLQTPAGLEYMIGMSVQFSIGINVSGQKMLNNF